jgi:DUF4097 and DUF4098 domain-containing protein YvlB
MQIRRNVYVTAAAGLMVFGLLSLQAARAAAAQRETEQFDQTIHFQPGGQLKLKNFSGSVTITGTSGSDIVVHAVRRATRDRLDHIHIGIDVTGSTVSIEANRRDSSWNEDSDNVVETDFDIQVPRATRLDADVFSSDVHVSGVSGTQKLHAFSGKLNVDGAADGIDASTFSGDIDVSLAASIDGHVDFDTFSGRLNSSRPIVVHMGGRHRSISGDLGAGGNTELRFKTFSGDVTLR